MVMYNYNIRCPTILIFLRCIVNLVHLWKEAIELATISLVAILDCILPLLLHTQVMFQSTLLFSDFWQMWSVKFFRTFLFPICLQCLGILSSVLRFRFRTYFSWLLLFPFGTMRTRLLSIISRNKSRQILVRIVRLASVQASLTSMTG